MMKPLRLSLLISICLCLCAAKQGTTVGHGSIVGHGALTGGASSGCTLPFTDAFPGSGALSSYWTNPTTSPFTASAVQASGKAVPSPSGGGAIAYVSGCTFASDQYSQFATTTFYAPSQGGNTGPVINYTSGGTFLYWSLQNHGVYAFSSGSYYGAIVASCGDVYTGDVVKLIRSGTTVTAYDVTTSTVKCSGTDSSGLFLGGAPGFIVDQGTSLNPSIESFQAN